MQDIATKRKQVCEKIVLGAEDKVFNLKSTFIVRAHAVKTGVFRPLINKSVSTESHCPGFPKNTDH